jgi:hypothetical protein
MYAIARIERGSEAWEQLRRAIEDDKVYQLSLHIETTATYGPRLKMKINGSMWTPTLDGNC